MKVIMLKLFLAAVGSRGLNCQVGECGPIMHDQVLLQQASGFSKSTGSVSEAWGSSCSSVVTGAIPRKSIWRRTKECMCPEGEVLHGADPVCWGVAGSDPYFLPDTMVGRECWCSSDNKHDVKAYVAFPWSTVAKKVCKDEDAKVVYWVRHAEGGHQRGTLGEPNKVACLWERDPELTDVGMKQAENLKNSPAIAAALFNVSERAQLVVSSPLQRTMLTAILGFTDSLKHELPSGERAEWLLDADCQEFPGSLGPAELNCNKGDPSVGEAALKKYHREDLLEQYQSLDPTWTDRNSGRYKTSEESKRFQDFTASLANREETRIIVVSHGKFMQHGLGSDSPKDNAVVKPYALCGNTWHYLGAQ